MREKPPLAQRLKYTWRFFRNGLPGVYGQQSGTQMQRKVYPFAWPAWRQGQPEWKIVDLQSYINEGFNLNTLIYSAVMYKARSISSTKLRAYTGDPEMPELLPPDHPLAKLIARPNPSQSQREYHMLQEVYLNMDGNCYGLLDRPRRNAFPTAIYPVYPLRMYIIPGDRGTIKGYLYLPEGKSFDQGTPLLPEDVMHVKLPNPGDPLEGMGYGLSPISPLARSADVDNMITKFLQMFFESGTMLNTYVTYDLPMDEDVLAQAKARFMEMYGGYENWKDVAFLDSGGKVQRFGMSFDEMGFDTLDERNEARILGPFGVPMTLIGTRSGMSASTYNNKEQDRRMFWEDTMVPEIGLFEDDYQYYLQTDDGGFVAFDLSDVPALRKDIEKQIEAAYKLWTMGETRANAYAIVGIEPVGETTGDQISYTPINMIPAGTTPEQPEDDTDGMEEATEDDRENGNKQLLPVPKEWTPDQKKALWLKADRTATSFEPRFIETARRQFEQDKREILALLTEAKQKSLEKKQTVNWDSVSTDVSGYLLGKSSTEWRSAFVPLISGVVEEAADFWSAQFGMQFDVRNLMAEEFLRDYTLTFADPISDTSANEIRDLLSQAQAEGWSIPKAQNHITTLFEQWITGGVSEEDWRFAEQRLPPYRAEMIARTETIRSLNAGSEAIYKQSGLREREWLATMDDRVRDSHAAANGQVKPVGQAFEVGGSRMMYPGDASLGAPPDQYIQCRCTTIPVIPGG